MSSILPITIAIVATLVTINVNLVTSDCCDAVVGYGLLGTGMCRDCILSTPCCGLGACNVLCCGCDGSCRQGDFPICSAFGVGGGYPYAGLGGYGAVGGGWYKRSDSDVDEAGNLQATDRTARFVFSKLDSNGDGKVDEGEMDSYVAGMYRLPNQTLEEVDVRKLYSFQAMDRDHDNYLSIDEIDS